MQPDRGDLRPASVWSLSFHRDPLNLLLQTEEEDGVMGKIYGVMRAKEREESD